MPDTDKPSFLDRRKATALERLYEQANDRQRVTAIVLRKNSPDRVDEVIRLGDDYLVEITKPDATVVWATVVGSKDDSWRHRTQEEAILHLIARRYNNDPDSNYAAAFHAARVLGIRAGRNT